jgi:hypothetical protein
MTEPAAILEAVSRWDEDRRIEWSERAAMIEYGDHVARDVAERRAYFEMRRPIKDKRRAA